MATLPFARKPINWVAALIVVFIVSRIIFYALGVRFDTNSIEFGTWQLINPELLRTRLLESLYYLHSQPPLFNLYVGIVLKVFPESYSTFFHINFLLLGLFMGVILFKILRELDVKESISFLVSSLYILSPASVVYENWLSYTYIVVGILTFGTYALIRFLKSEKLWYGVLFFILIACAIFTRSMYHLIWFVAILGGLIILRRSLSRKIVYAAALPFVLVLTLYLKNYFVFNTFSTSSWLGMSLYEVVLSRTNKQDLQKLVDSGKLNPIVLTPAYWTLDHYKPYITEDNPYPSVRVLTDSFNVREANYHNFHYLEVAARYKQEATHAIQLNPVDYCKNVGLSFGYYFYPASDYPLLKKNLDKFFWYNKLYNHLVLWTIYNPNEIDRKPPFKIEYALAVSFAVILSYVACAIVGLSTLWKVRFNLKALEPLPLAVISFAVLTIVYTMIIGNFFEQGENMRFRFETSTLLVIIVALTIDRLLKKYFDKSLKPSH